MISVINCSISFLHYDPKLEFIRNQFGYCFVSSEYFFYMIVDSEDCIWPFMNHC